MCTNLAQHCLADFQPQAVLTVAHNLGWMIAAGLAQQWGLPLHMIVHDDWAGVSWKHGYANRSVERRFARSYGTAASRLCVSPYMEQEYQIRYGAKGDVLYPSRAVAAEIYASPPAIEGTGRPFTIGFGGTLYPDHAKTLSQVAQALARVEGRLLLFGPFDRGRLASLALDSHNVECRGLVSSDELIHCLRKETDVLLVPMSFADGEREAARLSFPSKIADYTRAGLPLLIAGPPNSSAVRWAVSNPGAAEVVQSQSGTALEAAVLRLAGDPDYRFRLAAAAIDIGNMYFGHARAEELLFSRLRSTWPLES
jgi:hypothetical protein